MASKSPIKGILKRTGRSSKQEPEWKPSFPSNAVPTPNRYGPHPRQTTGPRREIFLSSSSVSAPPTSSVPLHSTSNYSTKFRSVSPVTSANLPSTNYELDHEDQPAQSLAPNIIQMTQLPPPNSEHSTAPWVLASREHHKPKKPMDVEFITRLADIRRQADGDSSSTSSRSGSLALLGSRCGSIASSTFSQSFSVASLPQAVEFPPGPVFTDALPAELIEKLKLLAVEPTPKAPALKNSYYPLQNSRTVITTRSLETTHEADNSSSTSSSPNSTPRQQLMQFAAPTKSIPYYAPNPSCYTPCPQTKTPTQTTPSSNVVQQPSGLTFASTAAPRTTKPFSLSPQPSNHSPPPMISPEHNPAPPNKETLKFGWNRFTLVKSPKGDPFDRGQFILSSLFSGKLTPRAQHLTPLIIQYSGNPSRRVYDAQVAKYPQKTPMVISTSWATFLPSSQNGPSLSSSASCSSPLSPQAAVASTSRKTVRSCFMRRPLLSVQSFCPTHSDGSSGHI